MHKEASQFIEAVKANAATVWTEADDASFLKQLLFVEEHADGSTTISDNFEKFFATIYRVDASGNWTTRECYSDTPEKPYSFRFAMADASMMYSG